jgi:hypothetical protein
MNGQCTRIAEVHSHPSAQSELRGPMDRSPSSFLLIQNRRRDAHTLLQADPPFMG